MKRYDRSKASSVEWLGEKPKHWDVFYPKYHLTLNKGKSPKDLTQEPNSDPYLTMDYLRGRDNKMTFYPKSCEGLVWVDNDQLLILWDGANAGEIIKSKKGYLSSTMAVIGYDVNYFNPSYLYYFLKCSERIFKDFSSGTTIPHFDSDILLENQYAFPPFTEQEAISMYLDYTVGKIEELIAEKEGLVMKLQEKRKALINEVVTCGLNPDAPMRPSGIDWLGNIPAHWELIKLKYLTSKIGSGVTPTGGAEVYQSDGVLFIRSQNVYDDGLRLDDIAYISDQIDNTMSNSRVYDNDVLLNITGASMGRCSYVQHIDRANVNQHVCIIRPLNNIIDSKYLHLVLCSMLGQIQIALVQNGGNREGLNFENIKNFHIPKISISEQTEIVTYITAKTAKIDRLVTEITIQIEKLKEYKTSVIFEAVTGKMDLREWQSPANK